MTSVFKGGNVRKNLYLRKLLSASKKTWSQIIERGSKEKFASGIQYDLIYMHFFDLTIYYILSFPGTNEYGWKYICTIFILPP